MRSRMPAEKRARRRVVLCAGASENIRSQIVRLIIGARVDKVGLGTTKRASLSVSLRERVAPTALLAEKEAAEREGQPRSGR